MKDKLETEQDILQAVVIADSFDNQFKPLTIDLPRCLIPMANIPLIEYTLEFLANANVNEVFILCCAHSKKINEYFKQSNWTDPTCPMKVQIIVCLSSVSLGDVLRELDSKSLIKSDFVLVHGDIVSNMNLGPVVNLHRDRRLIDKNAIMTMVLKVGSTFHAARGPHAMYCLDPRTSKCVQYLPLDRPHCRNVLINSEVITEYHNLLIRNDLIDCGIDICSIEVLALFSENFDYQHLRRDFVNGILESDLFVKSIYAHLIEDEYALRVSSTQLYNRVSVDIMRRWAFPLVPDANALGPLHHETNYTHYRGNVYREQPVYLSSTTKLLNDVILGQNSVVGEGSVLSNCVLGRNCKIGKNVQLRNAFLWDDCTVNDGALIEFAILSNAVEIKDNVTIERGCILGQGVIIDQGITLPPFSRITISTNSDSVPDVNLVGPDGLGQLWEPDSVEMDDEGLYDAEIRAMGSMIGYDPDELRSRMEELGKVCADESVDSVTGVSEDEEDPDEEIRATIHRALVQNHTLDNALLELNTLKFACNLTFKDLRRVVTPTILHHVFITHTKHFKATLERWTGVWGGLIHDTDDEIDLLRHITHWFDEQHDSIVKYVATVAMVLYESDTVEDTSFLAWFRHPKSLIALATRNAIEPFLNWLEEDEECLSDES